MEQLKQILQLKNDGVPIREIARRTGISRNAVKKYIRRLDVSTATDAPEKLSNKQLADKAYDNDVLVSNSTRLEALTKHFMYAEKELHKTGVNRQILWVEYKEQHPDGYNYSRYCYHFNMYLKHHDVAMHLEYEPGDITMMDFAGKKLSYVDLESGEIIECETFVSVLPYSGLIYCTAVHSQKTQDFAICNNSMLKFYEAVSKTMLCDNLKTAVIRSSRYEPVFTELCNQLSEHYQTTFSATRPYSPRDKAMVELAVSIVYTNIYAPLRNRVMFSLEELNHAIQEQLTRLNNKPYKNGVHSRIYLYETLEKSVMKPLPTSPFFSKKCVVLTVQRNYHVQLTEDRMYFSVHYSYVGKKVKVLYDSSSVEVYYDNERIALHIRKSLAKAYTTQDGHMPPNHLEMKNRKGWTREGFLKQAAVVGEYTSLAVSHMLAGSIYVEQNYKACYGLLRLEGKYTKDRLEAACKRAANGTKINYTIIKNILTNGLDKQPLLFDNKPLPIHENIRGSENYQ